MDSPGFPECLPILVNPADLLHPESNNNKTIQLLFYSGFTDNIVFYRFVYSVTFSFYNRSLCNLLLADNDFIALGRFYQVNGARVISLSALVDVSTVLTAS